MHGRADVVGEPRQCQRLGARAAAGRVGAFANQDAQACPGKHNARRETVGARADDDGVVAFHSSVRWPDRYLAGGCIRLVASA